MNVKNAILVIVPCYNESASIEKVVNDISAFDPYIDIAVVNDGSTDQTLEVLKSLPRIHILDLPVNLGIGGAVQTGLKLAKRNGYDFAVQIDGDGQHLAREISTLQAVMNRSDTIDLVIGSRFLRQGGFKSSFFRRIGITVISSALKILFSISITDPTSGFRLFGRRAISAFSQNYPIDFPEPTSIAYATINSLKVAEVAVDMTTRESGTSSIGRIKSIKYIDVRPDFSTVSNVSLPA